MHEVNPLAGRGLTAYPGSPSLPTTGARPEAFASLLALLMMSSPGPSEGGGSLFSMESLMMPLFMQLLEGLLARQTAQPEPSGLPLQGRLSQGFHPGHRAIDLAVPEGTPVRATMDGQVVFAGWDTHGYGNLVILENGPYRTYYAHLSEIPVQVGQQVRAGEVIGLSGNTGNSTGPHLHYEIRLNGQPIDPRPFTLNGQAP